MKIDIKDFRVKEADDVKLKKWATAVDPYYSGKEDYQKHLARHIDELDKLQNLLYAHNRYSLLLIFQAMDAAGKDGAVKHVLSGINPQGCEVFSFKQPSAEDLQHDFLWRTYRCLPERGRIGIFNRSYYEEVLILRVHPQILQKEKLPQECLDDPALWDNRYRSIVEMEKHLVRNGTRIIKFFLHVSKEEQRKRFLARIDIPEKNWKFSPSDAEERNFWSDYRKAYEKCISATSTKQAPWYIIPADDKENARLIMSQVIVDQLSDLKMSYPEVTPERRKELLALRGTLSNEKKEED